jgi:hypothetical protein
MVLPQKGMYVVEYGESTKNKENNSFVEKIMMGKKKLQAFHLHWKSCTNL